MGRAFEYTISFQVRHPHLDPDQIANELGMTPSNRWKAGDPRITPKGRQLEGVYPHSYCSFPLGGGDDGDVSGLLKNALARLASHAGFLEEVRGGGGTLLFYVFWYPNGDTGEIFDIELLRSLTELGIELGLNVYDDRAAAETSHG